MTTLRSENSASSYQRPNHMPTMAGILSDEQLVRELRVLYANRPLQFTKLITKYYGGARAKQIIETLKAWPK
jgi:hypothetical protein